MLTITAEVAKQVENITLAALYEKYPAGFVFDPIIVTRETDYVDGEEYMEITVIYDGEYKNLDVGWSLYRSIKPELSAIGLDGIASWIFCEKSEWEAGPAPD